MPHSAPRIRCPSFWANRNKSREILTLFRPLPSGKDLGGAWVGVESEGAGVVNTCSFSASRSRWSTRPPHAHYENGDRGGGVNHFSAVPSDHLIGRCATWELAHMGGAAEHVTQPYSQLQRKMTRGCVNHSSAAPSNNLTSGGVFGKPTYRVGVARH